jgi:hypothetical protein
VIKTTKPGRDGTVRVTFTLPADEPRGAVSVVGDFNDWDPFAHPLRRRANGTRSAAVTVPAGATLRFRYLAEGGIWFNDETAPAPDGQDASIAVLPPAIPAAGPSSAAAAQASPSHQNACGARIRPLSAPPRVARVDFGMPGRGQAARRVEGVACEVEGWCARPGRDYDL